MSMGEAADIAAVAALQGRDLKPEDYEVLANLPQTLGTVPSALRCIPAYVSAALPRRLATGGGKCTICLECCIPSESECIQLACACEFHVHCISDHLAESNQCPNCKTVVDAQDLAPHLYPDLDKDTDKTNISSTKEAQDAAGAQHVPSELGGEQIFDEETKKAQDAAGELPVPPESSAEQTVDEKTE